MPRPRAACGTLAAYRRHLRLEEPVDVECREAARAARRSSTRKPKESAGPAAGPVEDPRPVVAVPVTEEGHVSRLEVLREMLDTSRETIERLRVKDPSRVYLLMREQREVLAEIADLQGNGQVKGVTLADQLADARSRRAATA